MQIAYKLLVLTNMKRMKRRDRSHGNATHKDELIWERGKAKSFYPFQHVEIREGSIFFGFSHFVIAGDILLVCIGFDKANAKYEF